VGASVCNATHAVSNHNGSHAITPPNCRHTLPPLPRDHLASLGSRVVPCLMRLTDSFPGIVTLDCLAGHISGVVWGGGPPPEVPRMADDPRVFHPCGGAAQCCRVGALHPSKRSSPPSLLDWVTPPDGFMPCAFLHSSAKCKPVGDPVPLGGRRCQGLLKPAWRPSDTRVHAILSRPRCLAWLLPCSRVEA
jgi:hypothetical protein